MVRAVGFFFLLTFWPSFNTLADTSGATCPNLSTFTDDAARILKLAQQGAQPIVQNTSSLTCEDVGTLMRYGSSLHLEGELPITPQVIDRTAANYREDMLEYSQFLSEEAIESIRQSDMTVDPTQLARLFWQSPTPPAACLAFERQTEILLRAILSLKKTLGDAESLSKLILDFDPKKNAASSSPRNRVLRELHGLYLKWKRTHSSRKSAMYVARDYLAKLQRIESDYRDNGHTLLVKNFYFSLDPHSKYRSEKEATSTAERLGAEYGGVGLTLVGSPDGVSISAISPSLEPHNTLPPKEGDVILKVDGVSVAALSPTQVEKKLRGAPDTITTLVVQGKDGVPRDVSLKRKSLRDPDAVITSDLEVVDGKRILTISFASFYSGCAKGLKAAIEKELLNGPIDSIVLDLRGNTGGYLDEAVEISSYFIAGPVLFEQDKNGNVKSMRGRTTAPVFSQPLVVAIDNDSASAAELTAGPLQTSGRALVVGSEHSFGKGIAQQLTAPPGVNYRATATTAYQYFNTDGSSVQFSGVKSDVIVPGSALDPTSGEHDYPHAIGPRRIAVDADISGKRKENENPAIAKHRDKLKERSLARIGGTQQSISREEQLAEIKKIAADLAKYSTPD